MKAIILAAGYATRLYPLTEDKAKALLHIGNRPILDRLVEKLERVKEIDELFIVTNEKFYKSFVDWAESYDGKRVTVINDQTTSNDTRLGAIADIQFVIDEEQIVDDVIVLASDSVFDFELTDFLDFYHQVDADCIMVHELFDEEELKSTGVVQLDEAGRVASFVEKPERPQSNLAAPPFYIYQRATLPCINQYLLEGNNPDAPGNFIPWLIKQKQVYAYRFQGMCYDIGTIERYEEVQKIYERKN